MRAVIQRTARAKVVIHSNLQAEVGVGLLILLGISKTDTAKQAEYLAQRIPKLRIFKDTTGKMNLDVQQAHGSLLVVPNFTLYGDCTQGRRPGFDRAMRPELAKPMFDYFVKQLENSGVPVGTGVFGANMQVELLNEGPVTLVIDADEVTLG